MLGLKPPPLSARPVLPAHSTSGHVYPFLIPNDEDDDDSDYDDKDDPLR